MKIEYVKGDIFKTEHKYILHGCNAQGVMGAGIAKAIKDTYPYAFTEYSSIHKERGLALGETQFVRCRDKTVINAIIQQYYGRSKVRYVSYDAVSIVMATVEETLYGETIAMPMIGAGLGGGDWNVISSIIESELKTVQPVVYMIDKAM